MGGRATDGGPTDIIYHESAVLDQSMCSMTRGKKRTRRHHSHTAPSRHATTRTDRQLCAPHANQYNPSSLPYTLRPDGETYRALFVVVLNRRRPFYADAHHSLAAQNDEP